MRQDNKEPDALLTTAEVAEMVQRDPRTIRMHATRYNLGTLYTPRLRLFTEADVEVLREIIAQGRGEKRGSRPR